MSLEAKIAKYIPYNENILASVETKSLGGRTAIYCATERRLCSLFKTGVFKWYYDSFDWDLVSNVEIQDGLLDCTIIIVGKKIDKHDTYKEVRQRAAKIKGVNKAAGKRFVAVSQDCIYNYSEREAYRTKTCPDCDEIIKWKARRCKFCGYEFD